MTDTPGEIVERLKSATRPNASSKLLARKAVEQARATLGEGDTLEDAFPKPVALPAAAAPPLAAPTAPIAAANGNHGAQPSTWSDEDESAFQAMSARRKAAGYQRRGRDVGGQVLTVGAITPNAGTVSAVIVGLLTQAGTMSRAALLDAMAGAAFTHPKAKPQDRGWCQGYVSGALRDGFLALAKQAPAQADGPAS